MTFAKFKNLCTSKRKGDIKLPTDDADYTPLIQESLEYVAKVCIPSDLVTDDTESNTLRWITATQLIRYPVAPTEDTDNIDIDEELVYAVAYDFLANRTADLNKAVFYTSKRDEEINSYNWNNFKFLSELGAIG